MNRRNFIAGCVSAAALSVLPASVKAALEEKSQDKQELDSIELAEFTKMFIEPAMTMLVDRVRL